MSLSGSLWTRKFLIVVSLTVLFTAGLFFGRYSSLGGRRVGENLSKSEPEVLGASEEAAGLGKVVLRELDYEENSPNRERKILRYQIKNYSENLYSNYFGYLDSKVFLALAELDEEREKYIFVGEERTGDPHWLGNDYIFFATHCGTSCQGLYLVDVRNKESQLAVISYYFQDDGPWMTHFKDWFGEEFIFKGLVDKITSLAAGDESYLIFKMEDVNKNPLGEERLLFTGDSLKDVIE